MNYFHTRISSCFKQVTGIISVFLLISLFASSNSFAGIPTLNLRSLESFVVLAGSTVTGIPPVSVTGDVGLSPAAGSNITGFDGTNVSGTLYVVSAGPAGSVINATLLQTAKSDLTTAYNDAANRTPVPTGTFLNPGSGNIGGLNLVPGLYKFTGAADISGSNVTLTGNATDVWIFQIASTLNIEVGIKIILAGGAQAANIFWQVGTSASLKSGSVFKGTILADQSVTMGTGASLEGRALAFTAAVTMASAATTVKPVLLPIFTSDSSQATFGSVLRGGSKIDTITVTNTGGSDLVISSVTSSSTFFTVTPTTGTIAPLASRQFFITFSPTSNGLQTGFIVFNHNAAIPSNTITVSGTGVSPIFSSNSSTVSFGNVLNATTKRDSITVTNTGTANLVITNIASTNTLFTFTPSNGTYTLLPNANMKFYFTFAPLVNGAQIGRMIFDNNTTKLKDTVFVTGTGVSPNFVASSSTISFGNVRNETTKLDSITITNTGTFDLVISSITTSNGLFTVSPSGSTITPGLSQKYYVTFAPLVSGFQNGIIVFNSNTSKTKDTLFVNGTGVAPLFTSSSSTISFGNVRNLTSKMDSVTVTNTGTTDLIITGMVSSNNLFAIANSSSTITPGANKKFYVTFTPLVDGLQNGTIIFTHNGKKLLDTVFVNGRGVSPLFTINKTSLNYGDTRTNSAKAENVIVTNTGTADLIISSVTSTNIYFYAEDGSATITPGSSKTFFLAFNPINSGPQSGLMIFNHNALKSKDTITVTGNGVKATLSPSVTTLNFGTVRTGTSKFLPLTITNNGILNLKIYNVISTNSRFDIVPKTVEITPGASLVFYTTFMPLVDGEQKGMLIFSSNGNQLFDTVFVIGSGGTPSIVIAPKSINFGNIQIGTTKLDSISVTNNGAAALTINFVTSTNSVFTVTPNSGTVVINTTQKYYVTFAPVAGGLQTGNIVFSHDAESRFDTVSLTGSGAAPIFSVTPQNLDFGDVELGKNKQKSVMVKNIGTSDLTISNIVSSNPQFIVTSFTGTILPNATREVFITFAPTLVGQQNGLITFAHNVGNSIVNVTGNGIDSVNFMTIKKARDLPIGTEFIIEGIITRTMGSYTSMQDTSAGITIIQESGVFFDKVKSGNIKMGDKYRIQGKITELNAFKVIQGTDLIKNTLVSSNNQIPLAAKLNLVQIAQGGEKYESCLVKVENFIMNNSNDKNFQAETLYQIEDNSDKTNTVALFIGKPDNNELDGTKINGYLGSFEGVLGQSSSCIQCRFQLVPVLTTDLTFVPNGIEDDYSGNNLFNNYPNPFQTTTNISYNIAKTSNVKLTVLNIVGTEIATLVSGTQAAGNYNFIYDAPVIDNNSASNVYFYKLEVGTDMFIKKMIIIK